jgi:hypothetical protein
MKIYGTHTIAEYKAAQTKLIQNWVDQHFVAGSVTWKMPDSSHVLITDKAGDSMSIHIDEIDGHYIAD